MAITDNTGISIVLYVDSATPHEVSLVHKPPPRFLIKFPERLIGDKAYDSDQLDKKLAVLKSNMIAPIGVAEKKRKPRIAAHFADIAGDGRLNDSSLGYRTSAESLCDGNSMLTTSWEWFNSVVS